LQPKSFINKWSDWKKDLNSIPTQAEIGNLQVYYPHYTSPPRQIFHGTWGYFAYLFLKPLLQDLYVRNHFDIIHAHYATPSGTIALLAREWMKIPVALSIHGSDLTYTVKQKPIGEQVVRKTLERVDAIFANSTKTAQQILNYDVKSNKVHIVRLGADAEFPVKMSDTNDGKRKIQILSVGYLETRKGYRYLLQALGKLASLGYEFDYIIVGDGEQETALRNLARSLQIDQSVHFMGYKTHEKVWDYYSKCDIFVLPSWDEAFGLVYIEALSLAKPVIGCEGEGGPEDLKSLGDCIELVKPRDVDSIFTALKKLIDHPERRKEMGKNGQKIVLEQYSWEHTASTTIELYKGIIDAYKTT